MKKKILIGLSSLLLAAGVLAGCGGEKEDESKHNLFKVDEVPATCDNDGTKEHYECSDPECSGKHFDADGNEVSARSLFIESLGHTYGEDPQLRYLVSPASCTQQAVYYEACIRCGKKGTKTFKSGNALDHDFGTPEFSLKNYDVATKKGIAVSTIKCKRDGCGETKTEEKMGVLNIINPVSCLVDGLAEVTVEFSSEFGGEQSFPVVLKAQGHHTTDTTLKYDATTHFKVCDDCDTHFDIENHNLFDSYNETHHYKECSICHAHLEEEAHDMVWTTLSEPSAQGDGQEKGECSKCAYEVTRAIPLSAERVIEKVALLSKFSDTEYQPTIFDKNTFEVAKGYVEGYLAKEGSSEADITNLSLYRNAESKFTHAHFMTEYDLYGETELARAPQDWATGKGVDIYTKYDFEESGVKGYKFSVLPDMNITAYAYPMEFLANAFKNAKGDIQFAVKFNKEHTFGLKTIDRTASSNQDTTIFDYKQYAANEWVVLTIPHEKVELIVENQLKTPEKTTLILFSYKSAMEEGDEVYITNFFDTCVNKMSYGHDELEHWEQCVGCDYTSEKEAHDFIWTSISDPTATEDGLEEGVCQVCDYKTTRNVPLDGAFVDRKIESARREIGGGINILDLPTYKTIMSTKALYESLSTEEKAKVTKLSLLNNLVKHASEFYVSDTLTSLFDMGSAEITETGSSTEDYHDELFGDVKKHNLINATYFTGSYTHLYQLKNVGGTQFTSSAVIYVYSTVDALVRAKTENKSGSGSYPAKDYSLKIQLVKNKWNPIVLSKELMEIISVGNGFELQSTKALTYSITDYILVSDFYSTNHMNQLTVDMLTGATNSGWCARTYEYQTTIENIVSVTRNGSNNDLGLPFFQGNVQNTDPAWHYSVKYENISGRELAPTDLVGESRVLGINFDSSTDLIGKGANGIYLSIWCSHDIDVKSSKVLGSYTTISDSDLDELAIVSLHAGWNFISITDAETLAMFATGSQWVPTVSIIPTSLPAGFTAYFGPQFYTVAA